MASRPLGALLLVAAVFSTAVPLEFFVLPGLPIGHALTGNVPTPPAALDFLGGGGAWDGTGWGGGDGGGDRTCEGIVRQTLGLLTAAGRQNPVPPANQIVAGGGTVIGFTNGVAGAGALRAYNLRVTTFATVVAAAGALGAGAKLYSCGHGGFDAAGRKGGAIFLDGGVRYDGFTAPGFPQGTGAHNPSNPYPAIPAPAAAISVYLHHCYSGLDPDATPGLESAVDVTLGAIMNVGITHSHDGQARVSPGASLSGGTAAQQTAATNAILADKAAIGGTPFLGYYDKIQADIDAAVPPAGTVKLQLAYDDIGQVADPPGLEELADSLCIAPTVGGIIAHSDRLDLALPIIGITIALSMGAVLGVIAFHAMRKKRRQFSIKNHDD